MKVAKAKGRLRGKQPKLKPAQEAHLVELCHAGGDGRGLGIFATGDAGCERPASDRSLADGNGHGVGTGRN